ncbi:MAG: NTP transferase domain-containing protein [Bacteroidales bacterium]|nr:NTP transferase domain-containing protein [Bacteroidales bacterium]
MLNTELTDCGVIILAAGKSGRMGKPKFLLEHVSGETFLHRLITVYQRAGIHEMVVVVNSIDFENQLEYFSTLPERVKIIQNPTPEKGRLLSFQLGAGALSGNIPCFIHNIDNPFVETTLLEQLHHSLGEAGYVKPVFDGKGGHPILISASIVAVLRDETNEYQDFKQLLDTFYCKRLEVEFEEVVLNVNTREDYRLFLKKPFV